MADLSKTDLQTPKQAAVIDSVPSNSMSDSQLDRWWAANQGKVAYGPGGRQITVPDYGKGGDVRNWLTDPKGVLYGLSQTAPTAPGAVGAAGGSGAGAAGALGTGAGNTAPESLRSSASAGTSSYYTSGGGNTNMATPTINSPTTGQPTVSDQQAIQYFVSQGGSPNIDPATARAYFAKANPNYGQSGVSAQDAINYYIQQGGNPQIDPTTAVSYYEKAHPAELQKGIANAALLPEQRASAQMAQIDPTSEALRNQVAGSYAQSLTQATQGGPNATQLQSYLDTYKQLDPQAYAQRQAMGQQVADYVTRVTGQAPTSEADALAKYQQIDPQGYAQRQAMYGQTDEQIARAKGAYGQATGQVDQANAALKQVNDYVTKVTGNAPTSPQDALAKYQQLDPQGFQNLSALGGSMGDWLKQTTDQLNLGSQLDPVTARQVEQQTRMGQAARGNVYGNPQQVEEAMTTGQAGLALQAQRQAALGQAAGGMQSYLTSGQTLGDTAQRLYGTGLAQQQGAFGTQQQALGGVQNALGGQQQALGGVQNAIGNQQNWLGSGQTLGDIANARYQQGVGNTGAALGLQQSYLQSGTGLGDTALNLYNQNQNQLRANQGAALGYLGSGQTPYQAGAGYLGLANQDAASAAQGGPQYNPAALGQSYTGTAAQAPQYGLDVGAQAQNYFNSLNAAYGGGGAAGKNKTASALSGAASGALGGATAGTAVYPGIGTVVGGIAGAALGGAGGYFS